MPTNYTIEGSIQLTGVTFSTTEGAIGSTLSWTGTSTYSGAFNSDQDRAIQDVNDNGVLDVGTDFLSVSSADFTGYTITSGGVEYPVFYESLYGRYTVALPQDGSVQTLILASGTSNIFQNPAESTYLCFCAGTLISTPRGAIRVESLTIGDLVIAQEGRAVPVKWIGRQTVSTRFGPAERLMPVRFMAGSLGEGLPSADLTVTADHGMLVEGVICHAGALVNGTTITRVPLAEMGETYTVYHIETEDHEIILANGAPAETFIDNVSRRVFDNYAEFEALYGDVPEMEELPYPRAMSVRQVPGRIALKLARRQVA
jgi:hypothetical protein